MFALHILLGEKVKRCDIDVAERALRKFTLQFEKLYGAANMTFNVHLLTYYNKCYELGASVGHINLFL